MTKIIANEKDNSLFNAEQKEKFLSDMIKSGSISDATSKSYARILLVSSKHEIELQKDLNKFNLEELESILVGFEANNRNTIESYARIISSYFNWSINNGLTQANPLADLKPDDFTNYLIQNELYFTDNNLQRYEDRCENAQDAVIIRLLFMGVGGKQMSEIRNLSKDDIDFTNNRLRLINTLKSDENGLPVKFTERYLDVDQRTMEAIDAAMRQKMYMKRNGDMEAYENIRPYTDLVENKYVVRASITKTDNWDFPVDKFVIYRRIKIIAESLGLENLTSKFIQRSGMIYLANNLIQDGDTELSLNDLKMIAGIFNISSHHNLKGFLTLSNINNTYPK